MSGSLHTSAHRAPTSTEGTLMLRTRDLIHIHTCIPQKALLLAPFSQNPTINIVLCPAVLQRPDVDESGRYECGAHQNQPDPYGEVPQASGSVPYTGGLQSEVI